MRIYPPPNSPFTFVMQYFELLFLFLVSFFFGCSAWNNIVRHLWFKSTASISVVNASFWMLSVKFRKFFTFSKNFGHIFSDFYRMKVPFRIENESYFSITGYFNSTDARSHKTLFSSRPFNLNWDLVFGFLVIWLSGRNVQMKHPAAKQCQMNQLFDQIFPFLFLLWLRRISRPIAGLSVHG